MKTLTVALIGAGNRGQAYTNQMTDGRYKVVAVADPEESRRNYIKEKHSIPDDMCFENWEQLLSEPKLADIAIIATQDNMHYAPAMKAIEKGYNLLLEKPIAPTAKECADIERAARGKGVKILVCHVLRYSPLFKKIKELINNGKVGKVMSIHHSECVGNRHQSHSYVRGNWRNTAGSSNMLLAKSCHDMDIIQWLTGSKCTRVHSFGSLTYFTKENAPEGAPEKCIDGCPHADTCYYNAVKLYLDDKENCWFRGAATKKVNPTDEDVELALRTTSYGNCVFRSDNDVVDHQVVNLEFENGAVASFNMCAFNKMGRYIRVMGTNGEIYGDMSRKHIEYYDFSTREKTEIPVLDSTGSNSLVGGHGGGDSGIVNTLYEYMANGLESDILSEIGISTDNHMIAFAGEESRLTGKVIDVEKFKKEILN